MLVPAPSSSSAESGSVNRAGRYEDYRREVEHMVADDVAFELLEQRIDENELLAGDQKAALWLLAWSLSGPDTDRTRTSFA